jgi:hypothetical protein
MPLICVQGQEDNKLLPLEIFGHLTTILHFNDFIQVSWLEADGTLGRHARCLARDLQQQVAQNNAGSLKYSPAKVQQVHTR